MAPFATQDDLAARWRALTPAEGDRAEILLADASVWLRAWFPDIDGRISDGSLDEAAAVMVSCSMVKRAMLSTEFDGLASASVSDTAGMFAHQQQRVFSNPQGNLYITAAERDLLAGVSGRTAVSRMSPGL